MNTLALMPLLLVPLFLLARIAGIYPNRLLLWLVVGPMLLSFAIIPWPSLFPAVIAVDCAVLIVALGDLLTIALRKHFSIERQSSRIASLRKPLPVSLLVEYRGRIARHVWVRDGGDTTLNAQPDEFNLWLAPRSRSTLAYEIRPSRRGKFRFEMVFLRVATRLALWQRQIDFDVESEVFVYPDMQQLSEYAIMARTNRLSLLGVRRTRKIGQDNEFERLRDYTLDDNYKHIDWRSTARRNKLTVKDFQANQSQRIIFMIDCGRMMTNEAASNGGAPLSLLDHAFNAMLMLSFVALRQGDQVGLLCFSDEIHRFIPPAAGASQMNQLLHASFDRFPRLVESRYDQAFLYLNNRMRKRSLVVLISSIIDEVNAHQLQQYLTNLVGKHLPLAILLRDRSLYEEVAATPGPVPDPHSPHLFRSAAAAEILAWRHQILGDLSRRGVLSMDVFPEEMTAPLVNRYLEIKARRLL